MRPEDAPFPSGWWATSLDIVGLDKQRPRVATYGCYDYRSLPPLPFPMNGDFAWLPQIPRQEHNIGDERWNENKEALIKLQASCEAMGLDLPAAFSTFAGSLPLQGRIRSNTDCSMDVSSTAARSPAGVGYLIRFLADSQGCVFWYLYLTQNPSDHAVVASPNLYGSDAEHWENEPLGPTTVVFAAGSFEEFLCRFWLENELWFAAYEGRPLSDAAKGYVERYREIK